MFMYSPISHLPRLTPPIGGLVHFGRPHLIEYFSVTGTYLTESNLKGDNPISRIKSWGLEYVRVRFRPYHVVFHILKTQKILNLHAIKIYQLALIKTWCKLKWVFATVRFLVTPKIL